MKRFFAAVLAMGLAVTCLFAAPLGAVPVKDAGSAKAASGPDLNGGIWDGSVAAGFASGTGTEADPYIIATAPQLAFLAGSVNAGTTYSQKYFKLISNIVLNDTSNWTNWSTAAPANYWSAIGFNYEHSFQGNFNGDGHTISGIYINKTENYQGLFGYFSAGASVSNLGVISSFIKGNAYTGGIAGYANAIENCWNTGSVAGDAYTGGVAGYVDSCPVSSCYNTGKVTGSENVGGVAGWLEYSDADNCYNTGEVTGTDKYIGGIAGSAKGSVMTDCHNEGKISGVSHIGGIAGKTDGGLIKNCYNAGLIIASDLYAGGIAGHLYNLGFAVGCYNKGQIGGAGCVGGIAGYVQVSTVENCYNTATVGGNSKVGGAAGYSEDGTIRKCYNDGLIIGSSETGGAAGNLLRGKIVSCYYLSGTASGGINGADVSGQAAVLTDAQMKVQENFVGWDFEYDWFIDARYQYADGTSGGYPQLQAFGNFSTISSSAVWTGSTDTVWSGSGTEADPFLITSAEELAGLAETTNGGTDYSGEFFKLTTDITLNQYEAFLYWQHTAAEWTPIGIGNYFYGSFDGDGHQVSGIYIDNVLQFEGLFGYIVEGSVKNLQVTDSYIKGYKNVGGVAGEISYSTVSSCGNTGAVSGIEEVGGVLGYTDWDSTVIGCFNTGAVSGSTYIGGVVGNNNGIFSDGYNTGAVSGMDYVGGVSGYNGNEATACYNTGTVSGYTYVGGLFGLNYGDLSFGYNTGAVHGDSYVGGLAGFNTYYIYDCYNAGPVTGTSEYTGGVAGENTGEISDCYNIGSVEGVNCTGGVTGYNYYRIINCYNTGAVSGTDNTGGVAGDMDAASTISSCYYLTGKATGGIKGTDTAGKAEALTDAQMKLQSSFVGWDFTTTWEFGGSSAHYDYPTLKDVAQISLDPVTGVTISDERVTLNINGTKQLTATVAPESAFNKNVTWSSSDESVASVSVSGLVTALKTGKAVITVTTSDGGFTDTCAVISLNPADEAVYTYSIIDNKAVITGYTGTASSVIVPAFLGGCPVTQLNSRSFENLTGMIRVTLPVTLTQIATDAFFGCGNLRYAYFMGNAPTVSGTLGSGSPIGVTVYYRSGTTGWTDSPWSGSAVGIVPGDISGDGLFNMTDAVALIQRLAQGGAEVYSDKEFICSDIQRDGSVNMADIVKLMQALANPSVILY